MARKKQTRRATKNKVTQEKKAVNEEETKVETKDEKENVNTEVPVSENPPVSSQQTEIAPVEIGAESEPKLELKRKREEATSDGDANAEDTKKMKEGKEKQLVKEVSIRIERW